MKEAHPADCPTDEQDYTKRPIIVLGANHCGTRAVVELLELLGSDAGCSNNGWREEELFLSIHHDLISAVQSKPWLEGILDLNFIGSFEDDGSFVEDVKSRLEESIEDHFPRYRTEPWHWKCPTSALFMQTWTTIFPDAYYIHLTRSTSGMARTFLRRREFFFPPTVHRYRCIMNGKITRNMPQKYLHLSFESLGDTATLDKIRGFLPFAISPENIAKAQAFLSGVKRKTRYKQIGRARKLKEFAATCYLLPFTLWYR